PSPPFTPAPHTDFLPSLPRPLPDLTRPRIRPCRTPSRSSPARHRGSRATAGTASSAPATSPTRPPPPARRGRRTPRTCRTRASRSEEHTSELQSLTNLVCRLLLEKK